jgi:hypothetical protein
MDFRKLYGFYRIKDDCVGVNIHKIWKNTKNIDKFINLFTETYIHESIHRAIRKACKVEASIREEEIVAMMTGQPLRNINYRWYENAY